MGQIIEFSCGKCGYVSKNFLGAGMGSINPMIIERTLTGSDLEIWKNGIQSSDFTNFIAENGLCVCTNCKELQTMYQVSCTLKTGETKYIRPKCKTCNEERQIVDDWEKAEIQCPKCGELMTRRLTGHWD